MERNAFDIIPAIQVIEIDYLRNMESMFGSGVKRQTPDTIQNYLMGTREERILSRCRRIHREALDQHEDNTEAGARLRNPSIV